MKKKLFIKTHGCQMNEYDSAKMIDLLQEKENFELAESEEQADFCLLYTSPSPRDGLLSRMPSSA